MSLTRNIRLPNMEHWYMHPSAVYPGMEYQHKSLEVFIWETEDIFILTITDIPEALFFQNEDLICDIESLAHHLVPDKGSIQLFEFINTNTDGFIYDEKLEDNYECQLCDYIEDEYSKKVTQLLTKKYPHLMLHHEQRSFRY